MALPDRGAALAAAVAEWDQERATAPPLSAPPRLGAYRCVLPAGVTEAVEPGASPRIVRRCEAGQVLDVLEIQQTEDGRDRARIDSGWVSFVSASGKVLLEPVGGANTSWDGSSDGGLDALLGLDQIGNATAQHQVATPASLSKVDFDSDSDDPFGSPAFAGSSFDPFTAPAPTAGDPFASSDNGGVSFEHATVADSQGGVKPGVAAAASDPFAAFADVTQPPSPFGTNTDVSGSTLTGSDQLDLSSTAEDPFAAALAVTTPQRSNDNSFEIGNGVASPFDDHGDTDDWKFDDKMAELREKLNAMGDDLEAPPVVEPVSAVTDASDADDASGKAPLQQASDADHPDSSNDSNPSANPSEDPSSQKNIESEKQRSRQPNSARRRANRSAPFPLRGSQAHAPRSARTPGDQTQGTPTSDKLRILSGKSGPSKPNRQTRKPPASEAVSSAERAAVRKGADHRKRPPRRRQAVEAPRAAYRTTASSRQRTRLSPSASQSSRSPERRSAHSTADAPFTPQLTKRSTKLAARRRKDLEQQGHGFEHTNYGELLYRHGHEQRADRESRREQAAKEAAEARERAEMAECTFTPQNISSSRGRQEGKQSAKSIIDATEKHLKRRDDVLAKKQAEKAAQELEGCTFAPMIKSHKSHKKRPSKGSDRIDDMMKMHARQQKCLQEKIESRDAQRRLLAIPAINRNYTRSKDTEADNDVDKSADGDRRHTGKKSVHERLFHDAREQLSKRNSIDHSVSTDTMQIDDLSRAQAWVFKQTASPSDFTDTSTSSQICSRMDKDIAERRAKEVDRQEQAAAARCFEAQAKHTLPTSARLARAKIVANLEKAFQDADKNDKGGLTQKELESALRSLRVLKRQCHKKSEEQTEAKDEAHALQLMGYLFDYCDADSTCDGSLLDYHAFRYLLTCVLDTAECTCSTEEQQGTALELLPPDVFDALVRELKRLHVVNKHAFATGGAGGLTKKIRKSAVIESKRHHTFQPSINARSRQLERHKTSASGNPFTPPQQYTRESGVSRHEMLYQAGQASARKRREAEEEAAATVIEREGCTFWPQIKATPIPYSSRHKDMHADDFIAERDQEMSSTSPVGKVRLSRIERIALTKSTVERLEEEDFAECSFHPALNTSPPSVNGFAIEQDESIAKHIDRLRNGPNGADTKRLEELQRDADEAEEARLAAGGVKSPTKAVGPSLLSRAPKSETRRSAILNMEVNIGSGRKSLIVLRDGDDPATVAASFSRVWSLPPTTESKLTRAIEKQLRRMGLPITASGINGSSINDSQKLIGDEMFADDYLSD